MAFIDPRRAGRMDLERGSDSEDDKLPRQAGPKEAQLPASGSDEEEPPKEGAGAAAATTAATTNVVSADRSVPAEVAPPRPGSVWIHEQPGEPGATPASIYASGGKRKYVRLGPLGDPSMTPEQLKEVQKARRKETKDRWNREHIDRVRKHKRDFYERSKAAKREAEAKVAAEAEGQAQVAEPEAEAAAAASSTAVAAAAALTSAAPAVAPPAPVAATGAAAPAGGSQPTSAAHRRVLEDTAPFQFKCLRPDGTVFGSNSILGFLDAVKAEGLLQAGQEGSRKAEEEKDDDDEGEA